MRLAITRRLLTISFAAALVASAEGTKSCVDLQGRFDDIKADPKTGDTWVDLKSAFGAQQSATVEENRPQAGSMTVTYTGDGCTAAFAIQDGRVASKSFKLAAPGFGGPAAQTAGGPPPDFGARIVQLEAALNRLKAETADLEAVLAGLREIVGHVPVRPGENSRTAIAASKPSSGRRSSAAVRR